MKRTILTLLAVTAMSGTAFAAMDCDKSLESAMSKIAAMQTHGAKRASLARMMATGYDYCVAGDEFNAEKFFKMSQANTPG
jgi:hypothetical protein